MQKKDSKTNRFTLAFMLLFIVSPLLFNCGGGGGDGGDGGVDTGPFETAAYFPLSSGWQTDKWTLLVDGKDYFINDVATKAMADTRNPDVLFWTNDENGWRLHGFMDEEGDMQTSDPPLLFADSTCSVGDTQEGTYIFYGEEYNYTLELAGVETITVPAGTFRNCLKFVLHQWPSSELPSSYGYETFWLAKNVGFVKGMADENAVNHLFTENSETRQLLSYHITPSEMTADEQAIREATAQLIEALEDGDLDSALALMSDDYLDNVCRDKDTLEMAWINWFDTTLNRGFFIAIEDIQVNGDDAYMLRERLWTDEHISLGRRWRWDRQLIRWKKENGDWKHYGDHLGFRWDWVSVWIENNNGSLNNWIEADFRDCLTNDYLESAADILSLTVTGPPGSGIANLDLTPYWLEDPSGWRGFWNGESPINTNPGFYTFRVENQDGDYYVGTDYLEATPPMDLPNLVSPQYEANVSPNNILLDWNPVDAAEYYRIDMMVRIDGVWQNKAGFPVYLSDSQSIISLDPNSEYIWRIRARQDDPYGDLDNESRSDWNYFTTSGG